MNQLDTVNLQNIASPCIKLTVQAYRRSQKPKPVKNPTNQPSTRKRAKCFTIFQISRFLVKKNIHRDSELYGKT